MQAQDNKQEIGKLAKVKCTTKSKLMGQNKKCRYAPESEKGNISSQWPGALDNEQKGTRIATQKQGDLAHWAHALSQTRYFLILTFLSQNWFQGKYVPWADRGG